MVRAGHGVGIPLATTDDCALLLNAIIVSKAISLTVYHRRQILEIQILPLRGVYGHLKCGQVIFFPGICIETVTDQGLGSIDSTYLIAMSVYVYYLFFFSPIDSDRLYTCKNDTRAMIWIWIISEMKNASHYNLFLIHVNISLSVSNYIDEYINYKKRSWW